MIEETIFPYTCVSQIHAQSVLVLAPHPDDEVFGCGGAIAQHVAHATPVHVIILSNGQAGGEVNIRQAESISAAHVLGYGKPIFWDGIDREIRYSESLVIRLMEYVEKNQIDLIYCPSELELHPDHRQIALVCKEVLQRLGGRLRIAFYEVSAPLHPNCLLDITPYQQQKRLAMECFSSQLEQKPYLEQISALNRYRTYTLAPEIEAAEAFRLVSYGDLANFASSNFSQPVAANSAATPLVSILIRSMDRVWLSEALASVALQEYSNIEVIVVAATPHHQALAQRCGAHSLKLIATDVPLNRTQAANRALDHASGQFLLILDDDDWLMPEHISRLVKTLSQLTLYRAAYTGVSLVDIHNRPIGNSFEYAFDATQLFARNLTPIHGVLFHRSLLADGCRFDESLDQFEDWDFWLQISRKTVMAHISGISAAYRVHESSGVHDAAAKAGRAQLYEKWQKLCSEEELETIMERLWRFSTLLDENCHLTQALQHEKESRDQLNNQLANQLIELGITNNRTQVLQAQISALFNSRSWQITAPLRALTRLLTKTKTYLRLVIALLINPKEVLRLLVRAVQIFKRHGLSGIRQAIHNKFPRAHHATTANYLTWISLAEPKPEDYSRLAQIAGIWKMKLTISVVMPTFNSNLPFLKAAIDSVKNQVYSDWELCVADDASTDPQIRQYLESEQANDARIRILFREKNGHISAASNSALTLASGQFIALLDHDDVLHPLALWHIAKSINENPDAGILYSDEDKLSQAGERCNPYFKCDFNPELMLAHNMISHLGCYRKSLIDVVGGFREDFVGSQDYDLALRIIDQIPTSQIIHIPHVLYHWRITPESTALNLNTKSYAQSAAIRAISDHISRKGLSGKVTPCPEMPHIGYRVQFDCPTPHPKVSIIIPTRDKAKLLENCIDSILNKTSYANYEIIVMDNGSSESASFELFERLTKHGIRVIRDESPFNYSALNNKAAKLSQGQFICLMNNDIEVITPGWLEEMVSFAAQTDVGAVGARLWYPNDTIQHAGVIVGLGGVAGHAFVNLGRGEPGYFGRAIVHQSYSAVTAACLVVRKSVFDQVDGLDESLAIAFNDVDFCLRIREAGYRNVWTPYAEMYHHESASRGTEDTPAKKARFEQECALIRTRWAEITAYDPTYSPNLALGTHHFEMAFPPRTSLT